VSFQLHLTNWSYMQRKHFLWGFAYLLSVSQNNSVVKSLLRTRVEYVKCKHTSSSKYCMNMVSKRYVLEIDTIDTKYIWISVLVPCFAPLCNDHNKCVRLAVLDMWPFWKMAATWMSSPRFNCSRRLLHLTKCIYSRKKVTEI